jgi:hypothetical protein
MAVQVHADSELDLQKLQQRLKSKLPAKVYNELIEYTIRLSETKFIGIHELLNRRFERLNEEILAWTKLEESGQEVSVKEIQRSFFEIANPKEMYRDLERAFNFSDISRHYNYFLSGMKHNTYGSLFTMLSLPEPSFQYLNSLIIKEAESAFNSLALYSSLVKNHFDLIASEKSARGFKFFVKLFFKGISFAALGPMGSIGAGLVINALFDSGSALGRSMTEVAEQYDQYEIELKESLNNMEHAYRNVVLSLFSGAIIKANEALANQHLEIHSLNMEKYEFSVVFFGKEEVNIRLWAERQIHIIKRKMDEGKWYEVHALTDRFYHFVKSKPGMGAILLKSGRSLGRQSFLLKYHVVSKIAETLRMQGDSSWTEYVGSMLKQLPYTVKSSEAEELGIKQPAEWGMLLLHQALAEKKPALVISYLDYSYRIVRRMVNEWNVLDDEQLAEDEVDWNVAFGYVLSLFAKDKLKQQHPLETYHHQFFFNRRLIKDLRKRYLNIAGKDSMSRYLWMLLQIASAAGIIKPVYKVLKNTGSMVKSASIYFGKWLWRNGGKVVKTTVSLATILLLLYGGYSYKEEIEAKFYDLAEGLSTEEVKELDEDVVYSDTESFEATEDAFVDDSAQADANVETGSAEQEVGEEMMDSEGEAALLEEETKSISEAASDAVSAEELAEYEENSVDGQSEESDADIEVIRIGFMPFQVGGRAFEANLDEQTTPATELPFSLSITEERPDSIYVQSYEGLDTKPENIWVTNFIDETKQLIAVSYPDSSFLDVFTVSSEGILEERFKISVVNFTPDTEGFTYIDRETGAIHRIFIETGNYVDELVN